MLEPSALDRHIASLAQEMPDFNTLMLLNGPEFVGAAYLTLLKRPVDPNGLGHYLKRLAAGSAYIEVVADLMSSDEGRACRVNLPGLGRAMALHGVNKLPFLGRAIQILYRIDGFNPTARRLRAIEYQVLKQERIGLHHHDLLMKRMAVLTAMPAATGLPVNGASHAPLVADKLLAELIAGRN